MSLYAKLSELRETGKNFAYFCSFTNEERTMGEEKLFTGEKIVIAENTKILSSLEQPTPVILSFSLVDSIFSVSSLRKDFPPILMLLPQTLERDVFVRDFPIRSISSIPPHRDQELEESVKETRELIRSGEMLQMVISKEFGPFAMDPVEQVIKYLFEDRSIYVFYYRFGDLEVLGSSPENVVTRIGKRIMIEPIAGTRPVSGNMEKDRELEKELENDPKELLEHRMLVDLARNDLGKICNYGSVKVTQSMKVRHFSSVMHIVSRVEGELRDGIGNDFIVSSVFPAGTVSGAPKERAIRNIIKMEKTSRGPYAGSLGIIGKNEMDLALTIRTIYGNNGEFFTRAGAGIVKDSVPEKEVYEIVIKAFNSMGGAMNEVIDH